jgi:hypothetical protein
MGTIRNYLWVATAVTVLSGCGPKNIPSGAPVAGQMAGDTIRIANDKIEYEVIIIDPGFSSWFNRNAKPRGFYSQSYLEGRNLPWVTEWNIRVNQPMRYGDLFQQRIDYDAGTDYGYEVNYMLYYYLTYFQLANNVRLGALQPRI